MPPLSFAFESFGEVQVQRTLVGIRDRSRDLRPAFQVIRRDFIGIEKRQFATEGARASRGWAPLKPATIRRKAARGRNRGMLRENNDLFKSLTVMSNPNNYYEATRNSVRIWTSDPKAGYHQHGTKSRGRVSRGLRDGRVSSKTAKVLNQRFDARPGNDGVPQRKIVDLTEEDKQRWIKIIQRHVIEREGASAREMP